MAGSQPTYKNGDKLAKGALNEHEYSGEGVGTYVTESEWWGEPRNLLVELTGHVRQLLPWLWIGYQCFS